MGRLAPGTIIEDSSDPRTVEQNAALRRMQTADGSVGSQYAGCIVLPDGTVTRDASVINVPESRRDEVTRILTAAGKLNADGKTRSGGYLIFLNTDAAPIQYYGVSAASVQTAGEAASNALVTPAQISGGISHRTAIELAARGVQTDGTPVTESYLQLIERWAAAEGIPFTRPAAAVVQAVDRPAPADVVLGSGQGISAVQVAPAVNYAAPKEAPQMQTPVFTQGATIQEDFTPAALRVPTTPPVQESAVLFATQRAADTETAPATSPAQDASVAAAETRTKQLAIAAAVIVALVLLSNRKG